MSGLKVKPMKNHFIISYPGNKREEVSRIYSWLKLDGIETIAEPFAGTSALSYYISTLHPGRFKYRLNDVCSELCDLYRLMRDPEGLAEFQRVVNNTLQSLSEMNERDSTLAKLTYKGIITGKSDVPPLHAWYIAHKVYRQHSGVFPTDYKYKPVDIVGCPIVRFMRSEAVEISCGDGVAFIREVANPAVLIFADPPYISQCNAFYDNRMNLNFYEWLWNASPIPSPLYMVLESHWILNILLGQRHGEDSPRFRQVAEWDKVYQLKKHTLSHVMWAN